MVLSSLIFGFVTLSFEMVAFRVLAYHFALASYVFPLILSSFLVMMALGECAAGFALDKFYARIGKKFFSILLILSALSLVVSFSLPTITNVPSGDGPGIWGLVCITGFCVVFLVPGFFISAFYPALIKHAAKEGMQIGSLVALTLFLFTIANCVGGFLTNFVLFEYLGTIQTVYALVALAGIGVLILDRSRFALVSVVASVGIGLVIPQRYYYQFSDFLGTEKPMLVEDVGFHE